MTRHLIAASLAVLMLAAPAIALAQDAPATTDAPKKHAKHHKKKAAPAPADSTAK